MLFDSSESGGKAVHFHTDDGAKSDLSNRDSKEEIKEEHAKSNEESLHESWEECLPRKKKKDVHLS